MKTRNISKELILNTAINIADKKGLKNLTLKEIAEELGIKTPSLYNHVKGLEDVYNRMAYHGLFLLKKEIINAAVALSGKEALYSIANAYRSFVIAYPSLYECTQWINIWSEDETKEAASDVVDVLLKVLSPFQFTHEKNIHFLRSLRSYLHGFSLLEANHSFGLETDITASFDMGLKLLIEGAAAEGNYCRKNI